MMLQNKTDEQEDAPPQTPPPFIRQSVDLFPLSNYVKVVSNNLCLNLQKFSSAHTVLLSMKPIFCDHPLVPQVYLQQLWNFVRFQPANPNVPDQQDNLLIINIDDLLEFEITLSLLRDALKFAQSKTYDAFPSKDQLFEQIKTLGYEGEKIAFRSINLKRSPSLWYTL